MDYRRIRVEVNDFLDLNPMMMMMLLSSLSTSEREEKDK